MRGAAGLSRSVRCGGVAPASGTSRSSSTESPARTTSRTSVVAGRASTAPTASAAGEPAGPPTLPNAGPAGPSFPAAATVSVSSRWAPSTARASGLSLNAAKGSTSGTSAIRAASWASPSPFGSTARSRPASSWSVRA